MAVFFDSLEQKHLKFIEKQKMFFVATAAADGRINLSPKGYDSLKVLSPNQLMWLNLSGSGNETAAHLRFSNRMTVMFCSFEGPPNIMRLYGTAETIHPRDEAWREATSHFEDFVGARQVFDMNIQTVQTSCGYGVPLFDFQGDRDALIQYAEKKGEERLQEYWTTTNRYSIDGLDTGIVES